MRVSMPNLSRLDGLPELDTWKLVHHLLKVAEGKQGSSPVEMRDNLVTYKREVKEMVDRCCADVQQPSNAMQQMPATQLQTGAGGQFSLHGLQALQLQHLQQQPMMGSQAPQAQSVPYTTVAIANPVPPSSTPIDGGVSNVVHRPRPTAFTPVVKQAVLSSKAMGGVVGDKQAGSDHEATVSAEGDDQDKGEIVDQPHADIQKPPGNVQVMGIHAAKKCRNARYPALSNACLFLI